MVLAQNSPTNVAVTAFNTLNNEFKQSKKYVQMPTLIQFSND